MRLKLHFERFHARFRKARFQTIMFLRSPVKKQGVRDADNGQVNRSPKPDQKKGIEWISPRLGTAWRATRWPWA
jgi:hypothetical protein